MSRKDLPKVSLYPNLYVSCDMIGIRGRSRIWTRMTHPPRPILTVSWGGTLDPPRRILATPDRTLPQIRVPSDELDKPHLVSPDRCLLFNRTTLVDQRSWNFVI